MRKLCCLLRDNFLFIFPTSLINDLCADDLTCLSAFSEPALAPAWWVQTWTASRRSSAGWGWPGWRRWWRWPGRRCSGDPGTPRHQGTRQSQLTTKWRGRKMLNPTLTCDPEHWDIGQTFKMLRILPESRCLCLHRRGWWTGCRWWRPGQSATRGWCWPGSWACSAPRTRPWWSRTRSSPAGRGTWCSRLRRRCPPPGEASPGQSSVSAAAAAWPGSGGLLGSGSHRANSLSLSDLRWSHARRAWACGRACPACLGPALTDSAADPGLAWGHHPQHLQGPGHWGPLCPGWVLAKLSYNSYFPWQFPSVFRVWRGNWSWDKLSREKVCLKA